jgi:ribonuclease E
MSKTMLIDATHAEETRVAIVDGRQVDEFDFESKARRQLRGNIYLAKVTRVEPSLQAAFVEYGGNRHGFLAFNEIHPDYYQIPVADREAIMAETDDDHDEHLERDSADDEAEGGPAEEERLKRRLMRRYKIQDVIRRRQILLVQVVKDERSSKGAALTTWLSLAGRYCVLMPNTGKGGGISRKITQATDRKRLKAAAAALDVPKGMGLIIRTAGAKRTKAEIKRDYEYLLRLWETIRETTLNSMAPSLIYEEENLVRRAVRDMFDKDFDGIQVEGAEGWKEARDFMRVLMPSQAKKVHLYQGATPLFASHKIEELLTQIHQPVVPLKSGGYLVINQTEALVAIDVNSGRATKERNVEQTAFKTNMEAAAEAARQLRLRDLAGLIVIDFIDMDESKNNRTVEKCLKDALSTDRARIQMGRISGFGLMEISRQRRRLGVLEGATHVCEHCQGAGRVRSADSAALTALRAVDVEAGRSGAGAVTLRAPTAVALYILNHKRDYLQRLHQQKGLFVTVVVDDSLAQAEHAIERTETYEDFVPAVPALSPPVEIDDGYDDNAYEDEDEDEEEFETASDPKGEDEDDDRPARAEGGERDDSDGPRKRRRRRRGGRRDDEGDRPRDGAEAHGDEAAHAEEDDSEGGRRRRRGRRGGRRMREEGARDGFTWVRGRTPSLEDPYVWFDPLNPEANERPAQLQDRSQGQAEGDRASRPPRSHEARVATRATNEGMPTPDVAAEAHAPRRRVRRKRPGSGTPSMNETPAAEAIEAVLDQVLPDALPAEVAAEAAPSTEAEIEAKPAPRRSRSRRASAKAGIVAETDTPVPAPEDEAEVAPVIAPAAIEAPVEQPAEVGVAVAAPAPRAETDLSSIIANDPAQITTPAPKPKRGWWRR